MEHRHPGREDPADGPAFFVICFACVPSVVLALWIEARFAAPGAVIEDIEYHADRHLDRAQILRFAKNDMERCYLSS